MNVNAAALKVIDMANAKITKLPGDRPALLNAPEPPPIGSVDADNDPSKLYATIQKDGKTIATFWTSGAMMTPNGGTPSDLAVDGHGISLANTRIQQMLREYGGTVQYRQESRTQNSSAGAASLFTAQLAAQVR
jgi:hypothetical protein